jgi:hypothetical protein
MNEVCIYEEIRNGHTVLHFGNACYHFVPNLFTTCLPSNNVKKKKAETSDFPGVGYGNKKFSIP